MAEKNDKSNLKKEELKQVAGGKVLQVEPSVEKVRNKALVDGAVKSPAPDRRDMRNWR